LLQLIEGAICRDISKQASCNCGNRLKSETKIHLSFVAVFANDLEIIHVVPTKPFPWDDVINFHRREKRFT
jgi:hypothetical protein